MKRKSTRAATLLGGAALLLGVAGCGSTSVPKSSLESRVLQDINNQGATSASDPATSVSCPNDLNGKVGATVTCTATLKSGQTHDLKITVTSVSGSTVNIRTDLLNGSGSSGSSTTGGGSGSSTDTTGSGQGTTTT